MYLRRYNTLLDTSTAGSMVLRVPIRKAGLADFATSSDFTPATGDFQVSKDGGAFANIGTLPTYTNGLWQIVLSATELSCRTINVRLVDSATKAVDDDFWTVETFGHASAMWAQDYTLNRLGIVTESRTAAVDASGRVDVGSFNGTAYASSGIVTSIAAIKAQTDNLPAQPAQEGTVVSVGDAVTTTYNALVTLAGKFTGITSLTNWLRTIVRKDANDATALGEIGGTFDPSTDSLEAQAEAGAGGSGGATAAQVWAYGQRTLTGGTGVSVTTDDADARSFIAGDALTLTWTKSTSTYPTIANGDATKLRFIPSARYARAGASAAAELEVSGTASVSGSTITLSFTLADTDTDDLLTVFPANNAPTHQMQVKVPTRKVTPVNAEATVTRNIAAPS